MSANAETQTPQQPVKKSGKRKRLLLLLTLLFIIIAVAIGIYWFLVLRHFEETDDAYVARNQIQIMSQVSGSVTKVWADNTDFVKQGENLRFYFFGRYSDVYAPHLASVKCRKVYIVEADVFGRKGSDYITHNALKRFIFQKNNVDS